MHPHDTALSLLLSPIARGAALIGIGRGFTARESGIPSERIRDIFAARGETPSVEEIARLAAIVDQEVSVVPDECAIKAFTEVEAYHAYRGDASTHGTRVIEMLTKVSDLCIDMRLDTGLSSAQFARTHGFGPDFMARLADFTQAGSISITEFNAFLGAFGATLATFPRVSRYTNYYTALSADNEVVYSPNGMKAA
jgi:hypothetical protein